MGRDLRDDRMLKFYSLLLLIRLNPIVVMLPLEFFLF